MPEFVSTIIAPHYCCSCGKIGALLCEYCKYDIINESYEACLLCHRPTLPLQNKCTHCASAFSRAWCVGVRQDGLKTLIDRFKFERTRGAYLPLAALLDETILQLPADLTVVPVPTIAPHIRQRGYDQTALLARRFAKLRGLSYATPLFRKTTTMQRGASRSQRTMQAKQAFGSKLCSGTYLLIDDISTTGATVSAAAEELRKAGASDVWVAVLAVQPLE